MKKYLAGHSALIMLVLVFIGALAFEPFVGVLIFFAWTSGLLAQRDQTQ